MALAEVSATHPEALHAMEEQDDQTLLEQIAQRRDRASFAALFARYEKRAFSLALHLTHDQNLAQDAVQDAMLDIWLHASQYRPGNAAGWILRIVTNKSITLTNRRKQEGRRMLEQEFAVTGGRKSSPAELAEREEQLGVLRETLDRLPLLDRQVLALSYAGGLSQAEVGELLSLSQMSISRRLAKACDQIRAQLEQAGYAVALPMVSAEGVCAALCSGFEAPAGLREKVQALTTEVICKSMRTAASHSRRAAASKTGSGAWILGTAVFAAAGMGALWFNPPKAQPAPASGAPADSTPASDVVKKPPVAVPVARVPIIRTWEFDSADSFKDIHIIQGQWKWISGGGTHGSGCIETNQERCAARIDLASMGDVSLTLSFDLNFPFDGVDSETNHSFKAGEWMRCTYSSRKGSQLEIITHGCQRMDNLTIRESAPTDSGQSPPVKLDAEPAPVGWWRSVQFMSSTDKSDR